MKTLHLSIIVLVLVAVLFPFNTILAQNETQPKIWFDNASYATKRMNCNPYSTGIISEQGPDYSKATIIVTDPSANKYNTSIDRITVYVWSDSDKKGIEITAYETEVNSGIFKGAVTISEGQSTQDIIHVSDGDTLWAKYSGTTPWSLYTTNHGVTTTAFIGATCPPLERVPSSGIQVTDNKGNEQKLILADKQIQIGSNLTNVTIRNQTFAYIVQILDKDGVTESFSWLSGMLLPSQTFSPSVSWTPSRAGNYTANVFVWQSINNPNSLSPPISTDLTVWPSLSAYTRSTIRNAENPQCQSGYELVIKSSNNSPVCVTPDTAQKLIERGWAKEIVSNQQTIDNTAVNNTLTLGDVRYDTVPFPPDIKQTINLDGISFTYTGNGSVTKGDCYGTWVNQTEAKSFSVTADNEFNENPYQCWPPSDYPSQIMENGKPVNILPLRYSFSFFDINQTAGVAWCNSDICPMGKVLYLVKHGWNFPVAYDSPSLLQFYFNTNSSVIRVGQAIGIDIGDNNTQSRSIRVPFSYNYSFSSSSLFPCDYGPFRVAAFEGFVTHENLNTTEPLHFYQPGNYLCQVPAPGKFWIFHPLNDTATLVCHLGEYCNDTLSSRYLSFNGYWDDKDHFHLFDEGNYTIVAGDQWGHFAIRHFTVTNSTR